LLPFGVVAPAESCYKPPSNFDPRTLEITAMDTNQFLQTLDEVFQLEPGTTRMEDGLRDSAEFSSLIVLVLLAAIDEKFDVAIPPEELASCQTVQDLADLVRSECLLLKRAA
jgi:acyl carrier protein